MIQDQHLDYYQFCYVHPEWYDTLEYYQPSDELLRVVRAIIPPGWQLRRSEVWFHIHPSNVILPRQGWKIHISTTPDCCENVLRETALVCLEKNVAFKFLVDRNMLYMSTSKSWPREASGKFVTIYPLNDQHFFEILDALYSSLRNYSGPYILSDNRYKDAKTIYYRYGGINGFNVITFRGDKQFMLEAPDGNIYPDLRTPYWNPPEWVTDPFESSETEDKEPVLNNGRYIIEQALGFSATGGVYLATDRDTTLNVVIKEARPNIGIDDNGNDAIDRLKKEFRLLQKLCDSNITPKPIELFSEWEHVFLVEEFIPGLHLGHFTIGHNPIIRLNLEGMARLDYVDKLRRIWANLTLAISKMHDRGIVCGDLSILNVIVKNTDLGEIRIIDLEAAWEEGIDKPVKLSTPGFASPTRKGMPNKKDDIYSLGAIMMGTLFPMNPLTVIHPSAKALFTETLGNEFGVPEKMQQLILGCMSEDRAERPSLDQIIEVIRESPPVEKSASPDLNIEPISEKELLTTINGISDYIRASAKVDREDRLFPADPIVFFTNPLSVAYGAVGAAYALYRTDSTIPKPILSWILSRPFDSKNNPPGLYVGLSGIAWLLSEFGLEDVARKIMLSVDNHPLLYHSADIFYGASGYGLTCIRFYLTTKEQRWLDKAVEVGNWLIQSKIDKDNGSCCWADIDGNTWLGYARGASGISLFLLYLYLETGEQKFLDTGKRGLDFDLGYARVTDKGHLSIPRGMIDALENVLTHYWLDGSAGVATTLIRYWAYTKNADYLNVFNHLVPDTFRKYTVFPGLFHGLSGLGNLLLDAHEFTGENRYLREAYRTFTGISMFKINKPEGLAFPGEQLLRISTDFGTGSAGICLFLQRLLNAEKHNRNFNFVLDQLIKIPSA